MLTHLISILFALLIFTSCISAKPSRSESVEPAALSRQSASVINEAVVTYHPIATEVGYEVLKKGGNAFDAFVAATAAEYVLSDGPTSIGGPLGVLVYSAQTKSASYLDAGFNDPIDPKQSWDSKNEQPGTSALVPGAVAGLEAISKKFGKLSFANALAPSIAIAENGFPLSASYAAMIRGEYGKMLSRSQYGKRTFFKNGQPLKEGENLKLPVLAGFLRKLAKFGSGYVYRGEWQKDCVKMVNSQGGHLQSKDFTSYKVIWQKPMEVSYRGLSIYSPKTHGGLISLMSLKLLENVDLSRFGEHYTGSADGIELLAKTYSQVSSQAWLYQPDKLQDDAFLDQMFAPEHLNQLLASINKNLFHGPVGERGTHSYQITVIDREGNAVTGTNTIEGFPWGQGIFVEGVPLSSSGQIKAFANSPGKRRRFGLSMHIGVKNNSLVFASGAFNASLIPAEFQFLINIVDYHLKALQAVEMPRVGTQAFDLTTLYPVDGMWIDPRISSSVTSALEAKGFKFVRTGFVDTGLGSVALVNGDGSVDGAIAPTSAVSNVPAPFVGIGASLAVNANREIMITKAFPDSPAFKAHLERGDVIMAVQGSPTDEFVDVTGMSAGSAIALIRGEAGKPVSLKIRKNSGDVLSITLVRAPVRP